MAENFITPNSNPFVSYVSRADYRPEKIFIDVLNPRKAVIEAINSQLSEIIATKESRIQPILGSTGYGKTSLFLTLKNNNLLTECYYIYIPTPSTIQTVEHIFSIVYFQLIKQIGSVVLQDVITNITKMFGSLDTAINEFAGKEALVAEMFFALQNEKFNKTARFLLAGLKLENPILPEPGNLMEDEELCFAALKVISSYSSKPIIFFFDEIEGLFVTYGVKLEMRFLERIKRMYNELSNSLILLGCLTQVWEKILAVSTVSTVSRFESPALLHRFNKEDLQELVTKYMVQFFKNTQSLRKPASVDSLWPFTDTDLQETLDKTAGNPREIIKYLKQLLTSKYNMINEFVVKYTEVEIFWSKRLKDELKMHEKSKKYTLGIIDGACGPQISMRQKEHYFMIYLIINRSLDQLAEFKELLKEELPDYATQALVLSDLNTDELKNILNIDIKSFKIDFAQKSDTDVTSLIEKIVNFLS